MLETIGRGSFKVVRRAELRVPGAGAPRIVAAAVVAATALGAEAEVLLGLGRHPNLVRFIGMYEASPNVVLVTEFAPLGSLDNHLLEDNVEDTITLQHRTIIIAQVIAPALGPHGCECRGKGCGLWAAAVRVWLAGPACVLEVRACVCVYTRACEDVCV